MITLHVDELTRATIAPSRYDARMLTPRQYRPGRSSDAPSFSRSFSSTSDAMSLSGMFSLTQPHPHVARTERVLLSPSDALYDFRRRIRSAP